MKSVLIKIGVAPTTIPHGVAVMPIFNVRAIINQTAWYRVSALILESIKRFSL